MFGVLLPVASWINRPYNLMKSRAGAGLLGVALLLTSCSPSPTHVVDSAKPTPPPPTHVAGSLTSTAPPPTTFVSPTPLPRPTTTPSATPPPTLDPQTVENTVTTVGVELAAQDVDPLCLRWEDTDGDGEAEWLGLHLRRTDPPRLEAFVLDGETWHELQPLERDRDKYGLGTFPACELDVLDINIDGKAEILIEGHAEENVDLMHIFVWDDVRYNLLASFEGDAGVRVENTDGEPSMEVIVRHNAGSGLAWEAINTWDGLNYGWTWERYDWLYLDRPHFYLTGNPERAVISFYLALDDRDLPAAHGMLSSETRSAQPYQTWAAGFDTTLAVEVGSVHQTARTDDTATVTVQVRSYDNLDGYVVGRLWDTTWTMMYEEQQWRLHIATSTELERWEAPYFP
jgi:hypothetical protein